jgi:uncharacterized protein (TIGR00255 family)
MRSMTGFGVGEAPLREGRVSVEVRSLNHRFLETRVRLPPELADHTFYVEQRCRVWLQRGRCDISVRLEGQALPPPNVDLERCRTAYQTLCRLRDEVMPGAEVPLSLLAGSTDLFSRDISVDSDAIRAALDNALGQAIERLDQMRQVEGNALVADLRLRLDCARAVRAQIAAGYPMWAAKLRKRVQERVMSVVQDLPVPVEPGRIEAEVALLADRADLAEELARLDAHFNHFEALCKEDRAVGRRLDFLLQEISRESNTIGAKSQDVELAHLVVELKAEIERMREQVQNVE